MLRSSPCEVPSRRESRGFVVGTAVAATIPFMRYVNVFSKNPKDPVRNPFWWVWAGAQARAVLCFVIGMMTAVWGVANAWKP